MHVTRDKASLLKIRICRIPLAAQPSSDSLQEKSAWMQWGIGRVREGETLATLMFFSSALTAVNTASSASAISQPIL